MKAIVDKSGCIACGLCIDICPKVFRFGGDGLAEGYADISDSLLDKAEEARDCCPVAVIDIQD